MGAAKLEATATNTSLAKHAVLRVLAMSIEARNAKSLGMFNSANNLLKFLAKDQCQDGSVVNQVRAGIAGQSVKNDHDCVEGLR